MQNSDLSFSRKLKDGFPGPLVADYYTGLFFDRFNVNQYNDQKIILDKNGELKYNIISSWEIVLKRVFVRIPWPLEVIE